MGFTYIITFIIVLICCYMCEFLVFGVWYKLYHRSNIGYLEFVKKVVAYYVYVFTHITSLLWKGKYTDAPSSHSFRLARALVTPVLFTYVILLISNRICQIGLFVLLQIVVFGDFFTKEKTEILVQTDKWIRYLFDVKERPEGYFAPENQAASRTKDSRPLSRKEKRADRFFIISFLVIVFAIFVIVVLDLIFKITHGLLETSEAFAMFSKPEYETIFWILSAIGAVLMLCWMLGKPEDRKKAGAHVRKFTEQRKQKLANQLGINRGIMIDPYLKEWEKSILRMCRVLGIRQAAVVSEYSCNENMTGRLAVTGRTKEGIPMVILSVKEIDRMRLSYSPDMVHNMIRFLIGHELTHIRYKDGSRWKLVLQLAGGYLLVMVFLAAGVFAASFFAEMAAGISLVFLILLLAAGITLYRSVLNPRYWRHVCEYRADRIAAQISGADDKAIEAILRIYETEYRSTSRNHKKRSSHPELQNRLKELQRKKKWNFCEYVRYMVR